MLLQDEEEADGFDDNLRRSGPPASQCLSVHSMEMLLLTQSVSQRLTTLLCVGVECCCRLSCAWGVPG